MALVIPLGHKHVHLSDVFASVLDYGHIFPCIKPRHSSFSVFKKATPLHYPFQATVFPIEDVNCSSFNANDNQQVVWNLDLVSAVSVLHYSDKLPFLGLISLSKHFVPLQSELLYRLVPSQFVMGHNVDNVQVQIEVENEVNPLVHKPAGVVRIMALIHAFEHIDQRLYCNPCYLAFGIHARVTDDYLQHFVR